MKKNFAGLKLPVGCDYAYDSQDLNKAMLLSRLSSAKKHVTDFIQNNLSNNKQTYFHHPIFLGHIPAPHLVYNDAPKAKLP
jgi:hypothetical protein